MSNSILHLFAHRKPVVIEVVESAAKDVMELLTTAIRTVAFTNELFNLNRDWFKWIIEKNDNTS